MVNRYIGEIRINPVAILRNDDFNNNGEIPDIDDLLRETIEINRSITERISKLKEYLGSGAIRGNPQFNFSDGGYIELKGLPDQELLRMKSLGLIDLFDFATDRDWVKTHGAKFGLIWEGGRAVEF